MTNLRMRMLASTVLANMIISTPSFAQVPVVDQADPTGPNKEPDTSAVTVIPQTTAPIEGAPVPSTSAEGEEVESSQDIVVTGSRIPQPNLESASPVTVVTAQEVKLQGTTRTEDLINSLPQSFAAQGSNISNGSSGTATVNLRSLGSERTLVLVNGRRLMPGDPLSPVPDLNFVPAPLIKRVDVLTGGASSVYGADAVAGVVNFIMDTNFRGLRVDAQASAFMHDNDMDQNLIDANTDRGFRPPRGMSVNGLAMDVAAAFGAGFDDGRGSVMGYATYRNQDEVLQSSRDYSFCALQARREADRPGGGSDPVVTGGRVFDCGGSGTTPTGTFITNVGTFTVGPNGTFVPSNTTTNPPFNFAPYNHFQRPDERYTLGTFAEYEISEAAKPYLEAMFMDDRTTADIAPSGNFANTFDINCDNPMLSEQQRSTICVPGNTFVDQNGVTRATLIMLRRNVEGGPRRDDLQHTAYRLVGGLRGDLHRGLSYDAYYQYGTTLFADTFLNDMSLTRMLRALDVVVDPDTGNPVCRSALTGEDDACVPWNVFTQNGVTQEALDYIQMPGFQRGRNGEQIANVNFTLRGGDYGIRMPWTDRGISANIGAEYRKETLDFRVDEAYESGDLTGQGGPTAPVQGAFDVAELFAEVELPIVNDAFFHDLTLTAGYRYSRYKVADNSFSTDTYKLAAEFAPVRDVRFRGSYNRAVRAPNVVELFTAQTIGLDGSADPCAGENPSATLAQCQLTGVTASQYGRIADTPGGQYNALTGGNANLNPETADTYTLGLVLQPRFIPGLALTADYFDINLKDAIGSIGFDTIMSQCISTGDPFFCSRIRRQEGTGSLWFFVSDVDEGGYIVDVNSNLGSMATKGVDLQASFARQLGGFGSFNLSFVGTHMMEAIFNPIADISFDCAGFYGGQCGTPRPKWRHKLRTGISLPSGIGLSAQWRYFSAVKNDVLSDDPDLGLIDMEPWDHFPGNAKIKSQSYLDLALTARIAERYSLRLGANNILDREPPVVASTLPVGGGAGGAVSNAPFGNGNTFPQVYDALGRYIFAGVTVDF